MSKEKLTAAAVKIGKEFAVIVKMFEAGVDITPRQRQNLFAKLRNDLAMVEQRCAKAHELASLSSFDLDDEIEVLFQAQDLGVARPAATVIQPEGLALYTPSAALPPPPSPGAPVKSLEGVAVDPSGKRVGRLSKEALERAEAAGKIPTTIVVDGPAAEALALDHIDGDFGFTGE